MSRARGETSFILSNAPTQGALNNSSDGSYFEVSSRVVGGQHRRPTTTTTTGK
jgi:hypothetical protein